MTFLSLLLGLLLATRSPAAAPQDEGLGALVEQLDDGDKARRRAAVRALVALDTEEAWAHVVGALEDDAGEVADLAQWSLGALDDAQVLAPLLGKHGIRSRDDWVRKRAYEVLGRVRIALEAAPLLRGLRERDPWLVRTALWSLERQARAGRLADAADEALHRRLRRAARAGRDDGVRARAWSALAALRPEEVRAELPELLGARAPELRCVALALAPELMGEASLTALAQAAGDGALAVRVQVLESLLALRTRATLDVLVERLEHEREPRLHGRVLAVLRELTGMLYGDDPRPWRLWVADRPDDWEPLGAGEARDLAARRAKETTTRSAPSTRLPVRSERLAFLIDLSGSMWMESADGALPKDVVEGRLRETLEGLAPHVRFNVIPYTGEPHPWRRALVGATPRNVADALQAFARCTRRGTGNAWDAMLLALEDPEVDTLVVLTDGYPTGGRRHELELIVPLFLERNAWRKVAVDVVLVDTPPGLARHWERLARATGGILVETSLAGAPDGRRP